jgi:3-phenylpropionate/trans-cinnamate dioxygenase ferredoxin reductase subunit
VIVGGGYVGLEVAAVAVQRGLAVTVIETTPRLLSRVTGPEIAHYLETLHRSRGVAFRFGASVTDVELRGDEVRRVVVGDDRIEADLVVVGIGLVPSVELAQEAGLVVGDGIVVDEHARTSDPDILAIGDCANQPSRYLGERARLESVPNAIEHARVAALTLIGTPESSAAVPWFWSEQYGLKLQMVGLAKGCDTTVVRAGPAPAFAAFQLGAGRLRAADIIGSPGEFLVARRLVAEAAAVNPAALADPSIPLSHTVL